MNCLFHYTSRQGAQDIIAEGKIKTNFRRQLFLTTEICRSGNDAANRLGITGKPVEAVIIVSTDCLPANIERYLDERPIPYERDDVTGQIQRIGGGVQYILDQDLHLPIAGPRRRDWGVFGLEVP